ncbi:MAG TPA: heme-binding protein [Acetobacteraceae bacterium]
MRTADLFPLVQPGQPSRAPLTSEGQAIAGVGVSGGTVEQDVAILEAGLGDA